MHPPFPCILARPSCRASCAVRNASSAATPQPPAVDPSPTITRRYQFLSSPEGDADGCVLPVMALHGKRRRGSLDDVTRGGCVTAPARPAAPEVSASLALPLEDGEADGSAGGLLGLGRGKRRRGTGLHGTNNRRGANGLHAVALPAAANDGAVDAFVNQVSRCSLLKRPLRLLLWMAGVHLSCNDATLW